MKVERRRLIHVQIWRHGKNSRCCMVRGGGAHNAKWAAVSRKCFFFWSKGLPSTNMSTDQHRIAMRIAYALSRALDPRIPSGQRRRADLAIIECPFYKKALP